MPSALPELPPRDPRGHKGTFGTVCVIGGQATAPRVMIGAPALAATAALRSGAGLAVIAAPEPIMRAVLGLAAGATGLALPVDDAGTLRPSEVAALLDRSLPSYDCLAVGPGWGAGAAQQQVLARLLAMGSVPMVLDADALNAMAARRLVQADFRARAVLTPHPGEFRRLAACFGIDADPVRPEERPEAAGALARRLGAVVVLKGAGTVVSDGQRTHVNDTGNAALATAGTGDVLTGVIAGLVAQFFGGDDLGLFECAQLGVRLHGLAADAWASRHGEAGLLATELVDFLPDAMAALRGA